jgi:hypothetical protein
VWHIGYTVVKEYEYRHPQVLEGILTTTSMNFCENENILKEDFSNTTAMSRLSHGDGLATGSDMLH